MITPRTLIKTTLAAAILILTAIVIFPSNPEKAASKIIQKGRIAIESGNLKAVMSLISMAYHDDLGFNYGALQGSFGYTFSEFKNIKIDYRIIGFKTRKDTCTAEIEVRAKGLWKTANQGTYIAGTENSFEKGFIVCKKVNGRWMVISTRLPDRKDSLKMFSMSISYSNLRSR
jgi:hypothetical protein